MADDQYKGYRGPVLSILKNFNVYVWSDVEVKTSKGTFSGVILPRSETADDSHLVLKISSGYNVGVSAENIQDIHERGHKEAHYKIPESEFPTDPGKPNVTLLGTGGTIASRLDYRTGAVIPAFTPGELYGAVPELADICNLKTEKLFGVFSENMAPTQYKRTAEVIGQEIARGVDGIVIGHGTDTMGHTAAILSFMVQKSPVPIVMVGSQRSSDRPSSDAALNLLSAVAVASKLDIAEVCVVMHGSTEDDFCLIHRGTKVRKCHTSRRDAFQTVNDYPIGVVKGGEITTFGGYNRAGLAGKVRVDAKLEPRVALIKVFPGMQSKAIDALRSAGYKGIVLEGTGLGHTPESLFPGIQRAIKRGVPVVMTSQCIWGRVDMKVYSTGRDLLQLGVIPGEDMLPEVAWVKLMFVLGRTKKPEEVSKLMRTNLAGEISSTTKPDVFLKPALPGK